MCRASFFAMRAATKNRLKSLLNPKMCVSNPQSKSGNPAHSLTSDSAYSQVFCSERGFLHTVRVGCH
jgi:hypothetical protein